MTAIESHRLETLAIGALASALSDAGSEESALLDPLCLGLPQTAAGRRAALALAIDHPHTDDRSLTELAAHLGLSVGDMLAVRLAAAVDRHLAVGRAISRLQAPLGGGRPTIGLLHALFQSLTEEDLADSLIHGPAVTMGVLALGEPGAPLPERPIAVPAHVLAALEGRISSLPGATIGTRIRVPLPQSFLREAARRAQGIGHDELVIRGGSATERRSVAAAVATALGRRPVFIEGELPAGAMPWMHLGRLLPVFVHQFGPGERAELPDIPGWRGPMLAICGPDGTLTRYGNAIASWRLPIPPVDERVTLWSAALGPSADIEALATQHRHSPGRIAELVRLARQRAATEGRKTPTAEDVISAGRDGDAGGLEALAHPMRETIERAALVIPPPVARDLDTLLLRCRHRENLTQGLGHSAKARYAEGVRVLLVGPSGTGKTMAASWLSTCLGLPLYRVDMASIVSKYIGETEKNLATLMAEAEHAEVVLLFDEADSLFGKRTDVKQANDRFANAQTNYLLQRIETYTGITILTSNSRARFDSAFTRRLDMIIEFSLPGPNERRRLWLSHLGPEHALTNQQVNQLSAVCELAGGHLRNVVLAAAVIARSQDRIIDWTDILRGLAVEYRKLGKQVPVSLREAK